ncbi:hypothetical protein ALC57_03451 [Trachymyrmex cornetzi]|uniref:Uncharacterized protein n=1 Tax=Trachymyrmex cornetzi TaxID=471704 RepID=A0A195EFU0_9HYME|nr:hypothetical protein ALC57_03451 [Trachymyrmex cornetzi]
MKSYNLNLVISGLKEIVAVGGQRRERIESGRYKLKYYTKFAVSPENGIEPDRVYRRASVNKTKIKIANRDIISNILQNVKHTGREWTPFEWTSPMYDLAGSLDDVTSGAAFAPARTPIAGETLKGTRGIQLAAYTFSARLKSTMMWLGHFGSDLKLPFAMVSKREEEERSIVYLRCGGDVGNKCTTDQLIRGPLFRLQDLAPA